MPEVYYANISHHPTSDGGFILGGTLYGFTDYGSGDFRLLRLDSNLQTVWEKSFGGTNIDELRLARQTADGGFIAIGSSWSGASGNKSSANYGWADFWVVRTDSAGNRVWDSSFGGSGYDYPIDVQQTADGGFIVGGYSTSLADGNKVSPSYGGSDYWIVRLDASGNKVFDYAYGGSSDDQLTSLQQTSDGGFILAGVSQSPPSGNKTEPAYGGYDYWVLRIDDGGDIIWQRSFGGDSSDEFVQVRQGADGGFIVAGKSYSGPSGNRTSPQRGYGDYWVVALDADGNERWQESAGGGDGTIAEARNVVSMADGGWVVGGTFYTPGGPTPGGNKTSRNFGQWDYWLVRFSAAGTILWDESYGGRHSESLYTIEGLAGGGMVLIGESASQADGNKTTPLLSSSDLWILKLGLETPGDCDGDGVPDAYDTCPGTASGPVNSSGCSIAQLCPCNGPWTNHDEYVACVTRVSGDFLQAGLITETQRNDIVTQATSANCPYIPIPVVAFGLTNLPVADASLTFDSESGNGLFVSDIGYEGNDGLSIRLGEADSGVFIYPYAQVGDNYNEAWFMLAKAFGKANGSSNSLLATMRATKPYYEVYPVEIDFSALGSDSITYQVFAGSSLVAQAMETGSVAHITINSASQLNPRANPLWRAIDGSIGARIDLDISDGPFRFGIGGPFPYNAVGDHIFIWANNPTTQVDFVSSVDVIEGGGLENFTVVNARLGMFHHAHQALGEAIFGAGNGKLAVSNSAAGSSDFSLFAGVLIEADGTRFDVPVEPIRLETNDSVFETYLSTKIGETAVFDSVGITNGNGVLLLNSVFTGFDPQLQPIVLSVYNNGSLTGSVTNSTNSITITAGYSIPAIVNCGGGGTSNSVRFLSFTLDQPATFNDGAGSVLQGNQFRLAIIAEQTVPSTVSEFTLGVRNVAGFTILNEQSDSAPPALNVTITNGAVTLSWSNDNRPFVVESTSSLDQAFTAMNANVEFSNNRNKVTLPLQPTSNQFFRLRSSEN